MAFVRRIIKATFVLGEGDFGAQGQNRVDLPDGLRISTRVANAGGRSMGTAQAMIYGMTLPLMNKLSTLGMIATALRRNSVTLTAGDEGAAPAIYFQGTITNAWGDFNAAPDVPFHVIAHTGLFDAVKPATPISIKGAADVATMLSGIATEMGVAFENNGVQVKLSHPYYAGSPRGQAVEIVKDAGIEWNGAENGTLAIWNPGQSRGATSPVVSAGNGMRGYPTYTANGIMVQTVYNPSIGLGTKIKVESDLAPANGPWVVYKIDHALDSNVPNGSWFSTLLAAPPGKGPFVA